MFSNSETISDPAFARQKIYVEHAIHVFTALYIKINQFI